MVSHDRTADHFPPSLRSRVVVTGNPLRAAIYAADPAEGRRVAGCAPADRLVLVLGGSSGSAFLNGLVAPVAGELCAGGIRLVHQTGDGKQGASGVPGCRVMPFIGAELPHLMAGADLVVCRAGANTLAELAALGRPSLLVPLSTAGSRGDQLRNAEVFRAAGAADVMPEETASPAALRDRVLGLLADPGRLAAMAAAARRLAADDPAARIADLLVARLGVAGSPLMFENIIGQRSGGRSPVDRARGRRLPAGVALRRPAVRRQAVHGAGGGAGPHVRGRRRVGLRVPGVPAAAGARPPAHGDAGVAVRGRGDPGQRGRAAGQPRHRRALPLPAGRAQAPAQVRAGGVGRRRRPHACSAGEGRAGGGDARPARARSGPPRGRRARRPHRAGGRTVPGARTVRAIGPRHRRAGAPSLRVGARDGGRIAEGRDRGERRPDAGVRAQCPAEAPRGAAGAGAPGAAHHPALLGGADDHLPAAAVPLPRPQPRGGARGDHPDLPRREREVRGPARILPRLEGDQPRAARRRGTELPRPGPGSGGWPGAAGGALRGHRPHAWPRGGDRVPRGVVGRAARRPARRRRGRRPARELGRRGAGVPLPHRDAERGADHRAARPRRASARTAGPGGRPE